MYTKKYKNNIKIKEKFFNSGGSVLNVSVCLSDIDPEDISLYEKNNKKYYNFTISKRQTEGKYGETHTAYISEKKDEEIVKEDESKVSQSIDPDDLPF